MTQTPKITSYSVTQIMEKVYAGKNGNERDSWPTLDSDTISGFQNYISFKNERSLRAGADPGKKGWM